MPKLSQRTIDQVMTVNILDICQDLGLEVRGGKLCLCPFHEDHHPSMHIYQATNTFKCFSAKCGEQGSGIDLVMRLKGLTYPDAIRWIAKSNNIFVEEETSLPSSARVKLAKQPHNLKTSKPQNYANHRTHPTPVFHPSQPVAACSLDLSYIALRQSMDSDFCRAVVASGLLTAEQMAHAASRYNLGVTRPAANCSSSQPGRVIFWYQDLHGNLREGKVMAYNPDCHRDKAVKPVNISWLLKKAGKLPEGNRYSYCLFGEHLLRDDDKRTKEQKQQNNSGVIAIVESEKTAVIMSEKVSDVTWIATGGMQGLSEQNLLRLKPLTETHRIVLFPDTDTDGKTYRTWCDIAARLNLGGMQVAVTNILETRASPQQKERKIDIVDLWL